MFMTKSCQYWQILAIDEYTPSAFQGVFLQKGLGIPLFVKRVSLFPLAFLP